MRNEKQNYSVDEILEQTKGDAPADMDEDLNFDEDSFTQEPVKKEKRGWFGRKKKKKPDYDESEEMYYGVQVRPLDEVRRGFDSTGEIKMEDDMFAQLFDDTIPSLDEEVERNFQRIQRERRRRVAEAVETAGVDVDEVADELGIVAPMPVTSFSADPYAKQHGIASDIEEEDDDHFQKAMRQTAESQTMEIKLNVLNDTVELQKNVSIPVVDEDTVSKILETAGTEGTFEEDLSSTQQIKLQMERELDRPVKKPDRQEPPQAPDVPKARSVESFTGNVWEAPEKEAEPALEAPAAQMPPPQVHTEEAPVGQELAAPTPQMEPPVRVKREKPSQENKPKEELQAEKPGVSEYTSMYLQIPEEPMADFPVLDNPQHFRDKVVPVHIINIDVLQSAILTEAAQYGKKEQKEKASSPFRRFAARLQDMEAGDADSTESIDDYTSPADARSVAHELSGNMRQISIRLLVTGLSTVVLFFASLVLDKTPATAAEANSPIVFLIINLALILLCAGFSYKSLLGGLSNLMRFNANSDSAAAVATAAVLVQVVLGFLFQDSVSMGGAHLYGLIVTFVLFLNALGKLTMLRRIHSNFRFVTSREQKYAVRLYGDYNTSLKLAKDCVAGAPVIAYQKKAAFLKRFLQLSNEADPSENASQGLAPLGLLASLILFVVTMVVTQDFYLGLTAFAASSCVLVAAGNMLAVNLPMSKLCKRARRAGAMVVGYSAVAQMANVNAVMVDAADLFPAGTVVLDGIKTFGGGNKDNVIMAASALMREVGGTLADVFSQVTSDSEDELPRVSNLVLEDEHGVTGSVDGRRVLVGNRTLLMNHHVEPPERDEVTKYTGAGKKVVFIAVDGVMQAMLILTYRADKRRKNELQRMEENGVSLIVRSTDTNITQNMVGKLFGISPSSVNIITGDLGETYNELVREEIPRADALVATKGRAESMMNIISACVGEKRMISMITALQTVSVILGFVLVAFLACFSGISQLSALAVLLYMLFWVLVLLFLPKIKKP